MADQPLVVVLGDSLLMEGVAVSLANCPQMPLIRLDCNASDIWQQIDALDPDVIVLELKIPHSPFILTLLKERPGILLLGLDQDCNRVIVLNSRIHFSRTMHDLCQIVEAEVGGAVQRPVREEEFEPLDQERQMAFPAAAR